MVRIIQTLEWLLVSLASYTDVMSTEDVCLPHTMGYHFPKLFWTEKIIKSTENFVKAFCQQLAIRLKRYHGLTTFSDKFPQIQP